MLVFPRQINKIEIERTLSSSFYKATVILISQPCKYPTISYRSISFMNIDAKKINKILASQAQEHIKKIIHQDQVGFCPELQEWYNIRKSANVIQHTNKLKENI